jgi:hypothetical protein
MHARVGMLLLLELVSEEDVNLWRTRFEELDAVGDIFSF